MVHVTSQRTFQGWFAILANRWLALAAMKLPTKFEISISTYYQDMKGDTKCLIGVVWGNKGSRKVTGNSTNQFNRARSSSY